MFQDFEIDFIILCIFHLKKIIKNLNYSHNLKERQFTHTNLFHFSKYLASWNEAKDTTVLEFLNFCFPNTNQNMS